ncbi:UNVERIFIED_CONTAM: hypothetical protein K2H54_051790 [Gekko kuhli]
MEPKSLGVYWREEEVQLLLQSLHWQEAGRRIMSSTHLENLGIFARAAEDLTEAGYPRSPVQVRARFKRAKTDFFEALEDWEGLPPQGERPPYFRLLWALWEQGGWPSWKKRRQPGMRPRRHRRHRAMVIEAGAVSGTEEEGIVPGPSGEPQVPVQQQPEVCIVLQTTPEPSVADVTPSEHEGPSSPLLMRPVDTPPGAAAGGEGPVPAAEVPGPAVGEAPTLQSLAAQLSGHVAQADRRSKFTVVIGNGSSYGERGVCTPPRMDHGLDRILYLLDLQQKAFRRLNRDVAQLRQTLGLPPAVIPTDSEGPYSDPGATARGDLPLAIPSVTTSPPPVESGPTPPPAAGPSTSHGMVPPAALWYHHGIFVGPVQLPLKVIPVIPGSGQQCLELLITLLQQTLTHPLQG